MGKRAICLLFLVYMLGGMHLADASDLPSELYHAAPDAAKLVGSSIEDGFGLLEGAATLLDDAVEDAKGYLFCAGKTMTVMLVGVILLGAVECLGADRNVSRYTSIVGVLWITAVSAGDMNTLIGLGRDTIIRMSELSKLLLPALAAATAAGGGVNAASVRQIMTVFFSDLLLTLIERLLLPALYLYIGTAAASAVLDGDLPESIGKLLKKMISWALSGLLIVFTTFLSISGAVAGAADAHTVRLAKSAVNAAVPVVGGILAEAAETVLAGAGIMKGMIGAFGALAVISLCLLPFLRLGMQYLLYQAAGAVAQASGPGNLQKLFRMLGDAFALMLGMTGASALILIISLVSMLTVVTL